jgi:hypothetical protein
MTLTSYITLGTLFWGFSPLFVLGKKVNLFWQVGYNSISTKRIGIKVYTLNSAQIMTLTSNITLDTFFGGLSAHFVLRDKWLTRFDNLFRTNL